MDAPLSCEQDVRALFMRLMRIHDAPIGFAQLPIENIAGFRRVVSPGRGYTKMRSQKLPSIFSWPTVPALGSRFHARSLPMTGCSSASPYIGTNPSHRRLD